MCLNNPQQPSKNKPNKHHICKNRVCDKHCFRTSSPFSLRLDCQSEALCTWTIWSFWWDLMQTHSVLGHALVDWWVSTTEPKLQYRGCSIKCLLGLGAERFGVFSQHWLSLWCCSKTKEGEAAVTDFQYCWSSGTHVWLISTHTGIWVPWGQGPNLFCSLFRLQRLTQC